MKEITPCIEWEKKLSNTNPEDFSPSEQSALAEHLATCSTCAFTRAQYHQMDNLLRSLPSIEPLPGLPSQLLHLWEEKDTKIASSGIPSPLKHKTATRHTNSPQQPVLTRSVALLQTFEEILTIAPAQPQEQPAQPYPPRLRRPASTRHRPRNPVLISLAVMGFLLLAVFLIAIPFAYLANKANTQAGVATATANANATQQAKATAGVALTATSGTLILSDTLASNTNGRWVENTTCVFTGGSYHVIVQQTSFLQICPSNTLSLDNGAIQVDVSLLSGNDAGLLFRANGEQYYDFEITDQQQFFLRRHNAGTGANYTYLIQNTSSPDIAPPGKKNTLLLIANDDDFKLFINGIFVGEAYNDTLASGQVGFVVGTLASENSSEAGFANLKVYKT